MYNIFAPVEAARINNTFTNGLDKYTQANCQVTLENGLYHIYRPANLTKANNGSTMWGGLRIYNIQVNGSQLLLQGHTYIVKFHAKGQSSGTVEKMRWSHQMGNEGGDVALRPAPTNVTYQTIPANFQGEMDCFYKFTVSDDVYKVCTVAYDSSHVVGQSYLSYDHFCMNWAYTDTGTLGTDLYLSDFRMYDITNVTEKPTINKNGTVICTPIENDDYTKVSMFKYNDLQGNGFYEV